MTTPLILQITDDLRAKLAEKAEAEAVSIQSVILTALAKRFGVAVELRKRGRPKKSV